MPNIIKLISGGTITSIGIFMIAWSLSTYVIPTSALLINTVGLFVLIAGLLIIIAKSIAEMKHAIIGISAILGGLVITWYSFAILDPWTQLFINTAGIMISLAGGVLVVGKREEQGTRMFIGALIVIIGMATIVYSLTPLISPFQALTVNTYGIIIASIGAILFVKED